MLRVQALSILCTPYPFLDFHGLDPIPDKVDPKCSIKQDISSDTFIDFDEFSSNRDNLDPYCNTNEKINNDTSLDLEGFTPVEDKIDLCCSTKQKIHNNDEENIDEQEFSFPDANFQDIRIFSDDLFENGKLRTLLPHFDQSRFDTSTPNNVASHIRPPLKKIFINNSISPQSRLDGNSKETQNEFLENITLVEMLESKEHCKKKQLHRVIKFMEV